MDPTASLMHPSGHRPRVIPAGFPHGAPHLTPTHSVYDPSQPPPIVPRRTRHQSSNSVESSNRTPESSVRSQAQSPPLNLQNPIYDGTSNHGTKMVTENSVQLQEELHILRLRVEDQGVEVNKKDRELHYCHDQIKMLTTQLTEKKEELLKSEDRVVSMQADLSELREKLFEMERQGGRNSQPMRATSSESEMALRREVDHLHGQLDEEHKKSDYYSHQLEKEHAQRKRQIMQHEEEVRALQDQLRELKRCCQQLKQQQQYERVPQYHQPSGHLDGDVRARIQMLEAQVMTYKEDFETEREDRTRAQTTIIALKDEIASLQKANELLINERALQPQQHPRPR